jgi:NADH-quinone oxidoreductase subunit J
MHIILLCGLILCSILAVFFSDLLKAAISLAGASLFLALLFFEMGATYAGVFEISVVAGLITVLFISTISLTKGDGAVQESRLARLVFPIFFIAVVGVDILVMGRLLGALQSLPGTPDTGSFGQVLWGQRTFDLVGQIGIIMAGVLCVLALFRKRSGDDE